MINRPRRCRKKRKNVEKIVEIGREPWLEPATPDKARTILNLKGLDKVKYSPTNQKGFLKPYAYG